MRIVFFTFFVAAVLSINSCQNRNNVSFPNYGFDFPKTVSSHDSNEFYYPLKKISSRRDSILNYQSHYLFNAYDEENLSISPTAVPTIRFTYAAMCYPVIIKLTHNTITLKQGYKGDFIPYYGVTNLTATERLFFYNNYFGYDSSNLSSGKLRNWDSLTQVYPMFKDPAYYNYVLNKAELPNTDPLKYHTKRIHISHSAYVSLINAINKSGFWTTKLKLKCDLEAFDGGGFILEVNTGKKYNVIFREEGCSANERKILSACQDLVNLTDQKEEIQLYWNNETTQADTLNHSN
jgi:hypothetical protein